MYQSIEQREETRKNTSSSLTQCRIKAWALGASAPGPTSTGAPREEIVHATYVQHYSGGKGGALVETIASGPTIPHPPMP